MYHITGIRKRPTPLPVPGHHPLAESMKPTTSDKPPCSPSNTDDQQKANTHTDQHEKLLNSNASAMHSDDESSRINAENHKDVNNSHPTNGDALVSLESDSVSKNNVDNPPFNNHCSDANSKMHSSQPSPLANSNTDDNSTLNSKSNGEPNHCVSPPPCSNGEREPDKTGSTLYTETSDSSSKSHKPVSIKSNQDAVKCNGELSDAVIGKE